MFLLAAPRGLDFAQGTTAKLILHERQIVPFEMVTGEVCAHRLTTHYLLPEKPAHQVLIVHS